MKFELGQIVATRNVHDLMSANLHFRQFVFACMNRYTGCDWGELCEEDALQNDEAVKNCNDRILAAYKYPENSEWKIWIITEWDRSVTTILFPNEY